VSTGSEDVIEVIKLRARMLHKQLERGDQEAVTRLRKLPELRRLHADALRSTVQRRHCLALLARELGLQGWSHLTALWSEREVSDYGALFYPPSCGGHWNVWSSSPEEALAIRADHGGYLLPYKHQYVIVEAAFIEDMGVDPNHADWARIERNWIRPGDLAARHRLCRATLRARVTS
jgi:hypothetical protein